MPNILLVDDHPPIRDSLIRNAFPTLGWLGQTMFGDVRQADSFESGIAINPLNDDLAIIDILIPEQVRMTGITDAEHQRHYGLILAEQWRLQAPNLAIIFFSSATDLGYPVQHTIKKIGAYRVAYLPKGDLVPHALKMAWDAVQKGDVYLHPALVNEKYPDAARVFIQSRPAEMRQWIETACERMPLLSERETQVLELWGRGHNARAIGQLLSIHHRTVYDHINNIRAELLSDFKMNAENEQSNQTDALQVIKNTVIRDALILYDLIPPTFKTTK